MLVAVEFLTVNVFVSVFKSVDSVMLNPANGPEAVKS
jgi:hypothetical protein